MNRLALKIRLPATTTPFVGSSTLHHLEGNSRDFAEYKAINRGFGVRKFPIG